MVAALEHAQELAPPRALDRDEPVVAPLRVHRGELVVELAQTPALALLEAVEHHLGQPERVPDAHARRAPGDAEVLDGRVVGRVRVEDRVQVVGREVRVGR